MPVASSLSGKSWWGGAWSHKSVRKEEHKSEDDEATSELDVEEMLRRQMDADVRGDPGDGVLEAGGQHEQGAGVLGAAPTVRPEVAVSAESGVLAGLSAMYVCMYVCNFTTGRVESNHELY